MSYLVFLTLGLGLIWLSRKIKDDISLITAAVSGVILLIWGFAISPLVVQVSIEILAILLLVSLRLRHYSPASQRTRWD